MELSPVVAERVEAIRATEILGFFETAEAMRQVIGLPEVEMRPHEMPIHEYPNRRGDLRDLFIDFRQRHSPFD